MKSKSKSFCCSKLSVSYFILLFSRAPFVAGGFALLRTLSARSSCLSAQTTSQSLHDEPVSVLYESNRILAIDKPQGIPHHDGGEDENDLGILSVLRQAQSRGDLDYQGRLYGVHRLDRVTSGILLLAKDAEMASVLTKAFRDGNVTKYYVGISNKKRAKKKQGWVKGNMVRGRRKAWYLTREKDETATNMAVTRFFTASLAPFRAECT